MYIDMALAAARDAESANLEIHYRGYNHVNWKEVDLAEEILTANR